jgi:hypothetical protein
MNPDTISIRDAVRSRAGGASTTSVREAVEARRSQATEPAEDGGPSWVRRQATGVARGATREALTQPATGAAALAAGATLVESAFETAAAQPGIGSVVGAGFRALTRAPGPVGDVARGVRGAPEAARGYANVARVITKPAIEQGLGLPPADGSFAEALGSGATQIALQIPAAPLGGAGLLGKAAAFGAAGAGQQAGSTYNEAVQDLGQGQESKAATEAGVAGAITAVTSLLPGAAILRKAPGGAALVDGAAKAAVGRLAAAGFAEGTQEYLEGVGQEIATELIRRDNTLTAGRAWEIVTDPKRATEFAVGGLLGTAARGGVEIADRLTGAPADRSDTVDTSKPKAPAPPVAPPGDVTGDGTPPAGPTPPAPPPPAPPGPKPPRPGDDAFPPKPPKPEKPKPAEPTPPPVVPPPVAPPGDGTPPAPPEPGATPPAKPARRRKPAPPAPADVAPPADPPTVVPPKTGPKGEPLPPAPSEPENAVPPIPPAPKVQKPATWPARPPVATEPAKGRESSIVLPGDRQMTADYIVVEADDLIATHDPRKGFAANPAGDFNERPYHDPEAGAPSRKTVQNIAAALNPDLVLTDSPTAVDGPPITTADFRVVGGNARAMGIQLAYSRPGQAGARYRDALIARAQALGIDPERVRGMRAPVLVRAIKEDPGAPGELSRVLNEPLTTGRTREADAVSRAQRLGPDVASRITGSIGDRSLAEALADGKTAAAIMRELVDSQAVSEREIPGLVVGDELTPEAKKLVENVLVGAVVPDVRTLTELGASTRDLLVRGLSPILRLIRASKSTTDGAALNFRTTLDNALTALSALRSTGARSIDDLLSQQTMIAEPWREDARAIALARMMEGNTPTKWARKIAGVAEAVEEAASGQVRLGQEKPPTVEEAFDEAMGLGPQAALFSTAKGPESLKYGPAFRPFRIQPDPIKSDRKPKRISEMVLDLSRAAGKRVRQGKVAPGSLGTYYTGTAKTIIKYTGDLDVAAHEIGHFIDDTYGILRDASPVELMTFDQELIVPEFQTTSTSAYPPMVRRAEAVTEWMRAWLINPDEAIKRAPEYAKQFAAKVPADVREKLRAFGDDVRTWYGADPETRTLANIQMKLDDPGVVRQAIEMVEPKQFGQFKIGFLTKLRQKYVDALAPLWKAVAFSRQLRKVDDVLPSQDPETLINTHRGFDGVFESIVQNGPTDAQKRPIKGLGGVQWLLEPLDKSDVDKLENELGGAVALMVSERVIERAEHLNNAVRDVTTLRLEATALKAQAEDLRKQVDRMEQGPPPAKGSPEAKALRKAKAQLGAMLERLGEIPREIRAIMKSWGYTGSVKGFPRWVAERQQRMSGVGAGFFHDTDQAIETYRQLKKDPARFARLKEAARRYREWADAVVEYAIENGRISRAQATAMRDRNEHYVAMQRWDENDEKLPEVFRTARGTIGTARTVVQRFLGSTRTIANPYVNLLMNTYAMTRETDRNAAIVALTRELTEGRGLYQGDVLDFDQIGSPAAEQDENTIAYFVNGTPAFYKFDPELHKALKGIGEAETLRGAFWLAAQTVRFTRATIIYGPAFVYRQFVRDPLNRAIIGHTTPWAHFYAPTPAGVRRYRNAMDELRRYGGTLFGHYGSGRRAYYTLMQGEIREAAKAKPGLARTIITSPAKLARGWVKLVGSLENMQRLAEFEKARGKAKAEGMSDLDAGLAGAATARGLTDYAVMGSQVRSLNQWVMFLNAAIQSLDASVQAVRDRPLRTLGVAAAICGTLTMGCRLWNQMQGADDEERQLSGWRRAMFWNFKVGDYWLTVPKPYEWGVLSTLAEYGIDAVNGHEVSGRRVMQSLAPLLPASPEDIFGPLRPAVEAMTGYNLFSDRPIIPEWERNRPVSERKGTARASRIGKLVQDVLEVDARQVDLLIEGMGGNLGRMALSASDIGREDKRIDTVRAFTGAVANASPWQFQDVRQTLDLFARRGLTSTRAYRDFTGALKAYDGITDRREREEFTKQILEQARELRRSLEEEREEVGAGR